MSQLPDLTPYGYEVLKILNSNRNARRDTYQAIEIETQKIVVIKQFSFKKTDGDWEAFKQIDREIEALQELDHPKIPHYLRSFDSDDGMCLVQEYLDAPPLSAISSFSPEAIKEIALQLLEILIYLQNRVPTIIHRDLKLENVLYNQVHNQVYLVDFGLARLGGGQVTALSSIVAGTTGFMPPEQMLGQPLTEASDLYGLGATLICLLTGKKSTQISELVNYDFRINYHHLVKKYSLRFIAWLDQMVEPDEKKRFRNAEIAYKALQPLDVIRVPELKLSHSELILVGHKVNEKIRQTIAISNDIPETLLEGKWSVAPHKNDPPHTPDSHSWIQFLPFVFKGNQVICEVIVDTSQLQADRYFERKLILETNATIAKYSLLLKVKTAPIKNHAAKPPYLFLALSFLVLTIIFSLLIQVVLRVNIEAVLNYDSNLILVFFKFLASIFYFIALACLLDDKNRPIALISIILAIMLTLNNMITITLGIIIICILLLTLLTLSYLALEKIINKSFINSKYQKRDIFIYCLLLIAISFLIGVGIVIGVNLYVIGALVATGLPLTAMLIYPQIQKAKIKAQYRRSESKKLIQS